MIICCCFLFMFFFASTVSDFHKSHLPISIGWLDDIGLPQYKDQFHESRVDGRMLQDLTVVRTLPPVFQSSL